MPTSDVLPPDDVVVALKMFAVGLLLGDVDKVNGRRDVDVLNKVMSKSTCVIFSKMIIS